MGSQLEGNPAESLLRLWVIEEVRFDHFAHNIQGQSLLIFVFSRISKKSFKDVNEIFSREDFGDSVDCVHFKKSLEAIPFGRHTFSCVLLLKEVAEKTHHIQELRTFEVRIARLVKFVGLYDYLEDVLQGHHGVVGLCACSPCFVCYEVRKGLNEGAENLCGLELIHKVLLQMLCCIAEIFSHHHDWPDNFNEALEDSVLLIWLAS